MSAVRAEILARHGPGNHFPKAADVIDRFAELHGALEASPHMPSVDYDGFLRATLAITHNMADVEQAFRRMVFNVLSRNRDDHVRQHAYLMDDRGDWCLAPAFDLTFSNGPGGEHYMAVMGEGRMITRSHVEMLGNSHGVSAKNVAAIYQEVCEREF